MTHFRLKRKAFSLLSLIVIIELGFGLVSPAFAVKIPSAASVITDIERRYNLDPEALRNQGQQFNVANNKKFTPEVSLYFSPTDPKPGEAITAIAMPMYFSNPDDQLYYTWYLKRKGCDLEKGVRDITKLDLCNASDINRGTSRRENPGDITVEDWKIEAMRIIASNGYEGPPASDEDDNDGYNARYGGGSMVGVNDYCYYHDNRTGRSYELTDPDPRKYPGGEKYEGVKFACEAGKVAVCMLPIETAGPGVCAVTGGDGGDGGSGDPPSGGSGGTGGSASCNTFVENTGGYFVTGFPVCKNNGSVECLGSTLGTPAVYCVDNPSTAGGAVQISTCSGATGTNDIVTPYCKHLFPNGDGTTGDGSFEEDEEEFWRTDPSDPDTADNGNKDEANVSGLGQSRFKWNYFEGDLVGVVVEGTSMIATKHDDSSNMIMWAFSKNNCPLEVVEGKRMVPLHDGIGQYTKTIRGYQVIIDTIEFDLNKCLERNLVDPIEGGQPTRLEISLASSPENPQNDSTERDNGDVVQVVATIENSAKDLANTYFDWRVYLSPDDTPNPPVNSWTEISDPKLLSQTKGNALNTVRLKLNLKNLPDEVKAAGAGYLRFRVDARENFDSSGASRRGNATIIVKFFTAEDRIQAWPVVAVEKSPIGGVPQPNTVRLKDESLEFEICTGVPKDGVTGAAAELAKLDARVCRVLKNEIIGLSLDANKYTNFQWTVNGKPLICNSQVSPECDNDSQQGAINFLPITGNPGDMINVTVNANEIGLTSSSSQTVSLSRSFRVVEPGVEIVSLDEGTAWPKQIGRYLDADNGVFNEFSKETLMVLPNETVKLGGEFIPGFLGSRPKGEVECDWTLDGELLSNECQPFSLTTSKPSGSIYNVSLAAMYRPNQPIRKALSDIWGISVLDSTEEYFGSTVQLEGVPTELLPKKNGPVKYLALLSSYLPASVIFSLRVFLAIGLVLFVSGLIHSLAPAMSRSRQTYN